MTLFQCSICTAGSSFCSLDPSKKCQKCGLITPHICSSCTTDSDGHRVPDPVNCYLCTPREHICLSRCLHGCVRHELRNQVANVAQKAKKVTSFDTDTTYRTGDIVLYNDNLWKAKWDTVATKPFCHDHDKPNKSYGQPWMLVGPHKETS